MFKKKKTYCRFFEADIYYPWWKERIRKENTSATFRFIKKGIHYCVGQNLYENHKAEKDEPNNLIFPTEKPQIDETGGKFQVFCIQFAVSKFNDCEIENFIASEKQG